MRLLALGRKNFREIYRDRIGLGFLLGMPLIFMVVMATAFGGDQMSTLYLGIVDQDKSAISQTFIEEALTSLPRFKLTAYNNADEAREKIRAGDVLAFVVIPPGFGNEVARNWQGQQANISLEVIYDESDLTLAGRIFPLISSAALQFSQTQLPVDIVSRTVQAEPQRGIFNYIAPGMIVFGLTILISTSAALIAKDREKGILFRLLTTPVRPVDFVFGYTLPLVIIALLQIVIYLIAGFALGLKIHGSAGLTFAIFFLSGLCSIGIGMILSSFIKQENQANAISWLVLVPMSMLSGVWFPTDEMPSVMKRVADFFPTKYAAEASRDVVIKGASFSAIRDELLILVLFTLVLFGIGVLLFRRNMAR